MFKRIVKVVLPMVAVLVIIAAIINTYVQNYGQRYIVSTAYMPNVDAIIVLGAYVSEQGGISSMLYRRLDRGYEIYKLGIAPRIIVSGDHGRQDYDEVNAMKTFFTQRNVADECVFMDHAGFNTYDSMYRAKEVFKVKKAVIVTQSYHLSRALFIARELGIEAYGVSAEQPGDYIADIYKIRESMARNKAFLFTRVVKPKPALLGEAIPVSGDGRTTNDNWSRSPYKRTQN